ncbi:hypothetical protein L0F63_003010 [Massospora cicadina]|nr:hypothetical protein L0F63_003010 [Massospora cicadina]
MCCGWVDEGRVVVGGGGGGSRSGVKNSLVLYQVFWEKACVIELARAELTAGEDSPTSLSVDRKSGVIACGINGTPEAIQNGNSRSLRLFQLDKDTLKAKESRQVIQSTSIDDYQKVTKFSRDGRVLLVVTAGGQVSVLNHPSLKLRFGSKRCVNEDLQSGDISRDSQLIATASDKAENAEHVFVAINASDRKTSYLAKFTQTDFALVLTRPVAMCAILCFSISESGHLLAVGCSDLTIRICCPRTLRVLARFPSAHSFAVTHLAFSPDASFLLSSSADGTCRVTKIPKKFGDIRWLVITLLFLLSLLLSVAYVFSKEQLPLDMLFPSTSSSVKFESQEEL